MANENNRKIKTQRQLRIEAGPAQWQELDSTQCKAYMRVARMMVEAIYDLSFLNRKSTSSATLSRTGTAFLAGGRGTGKTTVLRTLKHDTMESIMPQLENDEEEPKKGWRDRLKVLDSLRGRIVWLETLDLEPFPPNANLLVSILMRIEDAAKDYGVNFPAKENPRGLLEPSSEYHNALLDLQRLQTDVALAWDGNLKERQGNLDPDSYAVEVTRIEKARLSLNSKFYDCINRLAKYVFRGTGIQDPLFVLPVDDFDLNPAICLDLLRMLRLISVPRLFTIVLGDLNVAATVFALKLSNDLGSIVKSGEINPNMLAIDPEVVGTLAGDVAANALRKLLPPGQRVELQEMKISEALNIRPLGADLAEPYLHNLLDACTVSSRYKLSIEQTKRRTKSKKSEKEKNEKDKYEYSLLEILLVPEIGILAPKRKQKRGLAKYEENGELKSEVVDDSIYEGIRFVEAPPRRVNDTWLELYKITNGGQGRETEKITERLLTHFAGMCKAALRETQTFRPAERDDIERAIDQTVTGSWTLRALPVLVTTEIIRSEPIEIRLPDYLLFNVPTKDKKGSKGVPSKIYPQRISIAITEPLHWRMESTYRRRTSPPGLEVDWGGHGQLDPWQSDPRDWRWPGRALPDATVTALIVYHDLLALSKSDDSQFTNLLTPTNFVVDWAVTEWLPNIARFSWPKPPALTFFHIDRFKSAWRKAINHKIPATDKDNQVEQVNWLVFAWLSLGTSVVANEPPTTMTKHSSEMPWSELISKLEEAEDKASNTQVAESADCREWLLRVAELLMPEMGLPKNIGEVIFGSAKLSEFWQNNRSVIEQWRIHQLSRIATMSPDLAEGLREPPEVSFASDFAPKAVVIYDRSKRLRESRESTRRRSEW